MSKKLLGAALVPLLLATSAPAAQPRGFAGAAIGLSEAELGIKSNPLLEPLPVDDQDTSWKLLAGFGSRHVGFEAAWIEFGSWTGAGTDGTADLSLDASASGLDLAIYGRLTLGKRTALFGKVGALIWDSDKTTTSIFPGGLGPPQVIIREESPRGTHLSWGLGAEFRAVGPLWVRVEYQDFGASGGATDLQTATVGLVVELGGRKESSP